MKPRLFFTASWVLLLLLALVVTYFSISSAMFALASNTGTLTAGVTLQQVSEKLVPEAAIAIRGRQVTAATWALAFALLMGYVTLVPYRRGERWAWWALLLSLGLSQLTSITRIVALDTVHGTGVSIVLLSILALGLAAGAPRMFGKQPSTDEDA
jgi:hypothetical protein